MSSIWIKTEYEESGSDGSMDKKTLYCRHNNTVDVTLFYDEKGNIIFSYEDTGNNNLMDAILRLRSPFNGKELDSDVSYMTSEERDNCLNWFSSAASKEVKFRQMELALDTLAKIHFYGNFIPETMNEKSLSALMNVMGFKYESEGQIVNGRK